MLHFKMAPYISPTTMIITALVFFAGIMLYQQYQSSPCEQTCFQKGYVDFRYLSEGRFGYPPEKCFCLTKEESEHKNRFYLGTKINLRHE